MPNDVDFRDLLEQPMSEFPDRPNLAGGKYYYGKLTGLTAGHSSQKGTPFFQFGVRLTEPGKDVPRESLDAMTAAGFSLADYDVTADFYLTPRAITMLRRFLTSLGFSENQSFTETLKLVPSGPERGNPTPESQDVVRGLDVLVQMPPPDEQGRVFNRANTIVGVKRD